MKNGVRALVLGLLLLAGLARPAAAYRRTGLFQTGDQILDAGALDARVGADLPFTKLGWHYHRFAVFELDLWRWSGEPCVYGGDSYIVLTDDEAAEAGLHGAPLRYHVPPGLLVLLGLIELAFITRTKRPLKVTLGIGAALGVVTLLFWLGGLTWELIVPGGLALHHVLGSWLALSHQDKIDEHEAALADAAAHARPDDPEPTDDTIAPRSKLPPPPRIEADPFRAPPQAPPIKIVRPDTAPVAAPVVVDPNAEKPKLLS